MTHSTVVAAITSERFLAVVRTAVQQDSKDIVGKLVTAGTSILELTTTIDGWPQLLQDLTIRYPDVIFGMGTVTNRRDAETACAAGASFLVSPYQADDVRKITDDAQVLFIEGGITPAEIGRITAVGIAKLFPAHLGGIAYLKSIKSILPASQIIPTGGITVADVPAWLDAGALAVAVGSDLYIAADVVSEVRALRARIKRAKPINP